MQLFILILSKAFLVLLLSLSFSIIYFPTRYFNIAHAAIITLGGYFTFFFFRQLSIEFYLSIIFSIIISAFIGALIEVFIIRKFRNKSNSSLSYLLLSLGLYIVIINVITLIWGDDPLSIRLSEATLGHNLFDGYITNIQLTTIFVGSIIFISVLVFFKYSSIGRKIKALSSNRSLSEIYGINSDSVILITVLIGSTIAAISGILASYNTDISPNMGFNLFIYGTIGMIISGVNKYKWLLFGALIISFAQIIGAYYIGNMWMDTILYLVLIIILIFRPLGLSGELLKKIQI